MGLNGLICADVPLSNYSLTHSLVLGCSRWSLVEAALAEHKVWWCTCRYYITPRTLGVTSGTAVSQTESLLLCAAAVWPADDFTAAAAAAAAMWAEPHLHPAWTNSRWSTASGLLWMNEWMIYTAVGSDHWPLLTLAGIASVDFSTLSSVTRECNSQTIDKHYLKTNHNFQTDTSTA